MHKKLSILNNKLVKRSSHIMTKDKKNAMHVKNDNSNNQLEI